MRSDIDLEFWSKAEEMTALCCLCRTFSEFQAKKCSSLEANNTKDKHTEILPKQKGVKKLCPFSLEKKKSWGWEVGGEEGTVFHVL